MNYNIDYINDLMRNHPLESEYEQTALSPQKDIIMSGGDNTTSSNVPTGGFPPIYMCDEKQKKEPKMIKERAISLSADVVSIRDILAHRKKSK